MIHTYCLLFRYKLVCYACIKIWLMLRRRRSVSTIRSNCTCIYDYASAMTNTEIVVTKTEHVDRVPRTHDKWLRSIRTEESINWKKNTSRCSYMYNVIRSYTHSRHRTRRMNRSRRCNVILLSRERVCVFFFYIL
jgi:hypothetical protein